MMTKTMTMNGHWLIMTITQLIKKEYDKVEVTDKDNENKGTPYNDSTENDTHDKVQFPTVHLPPSSSLFSCLCYGYFHVYLFKEVTLHLNQLQAYNEIKLITRL